MQSRGNQTDSASRITRSEAIGKYNLLREEWDRWIQEGLLRPSISNAPHEHAETFSTATVKALAKTSMSRRQKRATWLSVASMLIASASMTIGGIGCHEGKKSKQQSIVAAITRIRHATYENLRSGMIRSKPADRTTARELLSEMNAAGVTDADGSGVRLELLIQAGQIGAANELIKQLRQGGTADADLPLSIGRYWLEAGKAKEALPYLQSTDIAYAKEIMCTLLSEAHLELGEIDKASSALRTFILAEGGGGLAVKQLARILLLQNDPHGAKALCEQYLGSEAEGVAEIRIALAESFLNTGEAELALGQLRLVPEISQHSDALFALGRALGAIGDHSGAVEALKGALNLRPGDQDITLYLAYTYWGTNEPGLAKATLSRLPNEDREPSLRYEILSRLIEYERSLGSDGAALIELWASSKDTTRTRENAVFLALLAWKVAAVEWTEAQVAGTDSPDLAERLAVRLQGELATAPNVERLLGSFVEYAGKSRNRALVQTAWKLCMQWRDLNPASETACRSLILLTAEIINFPSLKGIIDFGPVTEAAHLLQELEPGSGLMRAQDDYYCAFAFHNHAESLVADHQFMDMDSGLFALARRLYLRAIQVADENAASSILHGMTHAEISFRARGNLGDLLYDIGELASARNMFLEALDHIPDSFSDEMRQMVVALISNEITEIDKIKE